MAVAEELFRRKLELTLHGLGVKLVLDALHVDGVLQRGLLTESGFDELHHIQALGPAENFAHFAGFESGGKLLKDAEHLVPGEGGNLAPVARAGRVAVGAGGLGEGGLTREDAFAQGAHFVFCNGLIFEGFVVAGGFQNVAHAGAGRIAHLAAVLLHVLHLVGLGDADLGRHDVEDVRNLIAAQPIVVGAQIAFGGRNIARDGGDDLIGEHVIVDVAAQCHGKRLALAGGLRLVVLVDEVGGGETVGKNDPQPEVLFGDGAIGCARHDLVGAAHVDRPEKRVIHLAGRRRLELGRHINARIHGTGAEVARLRNKIAFALRCRHRADRQACHNHHPQCGAHTNSLIISPSTDWAYRKSGPVGKPKTKAARVELKMVGEGWWMEGWTRWTIWTKWTLWTPRGDGWICIRLSAKKYPAALP